VKLGSKATVGNTRSPQAFTGVREQTINWTMNSLTLLIRVGIKQ